MPAKRPQLSSRRSRRLSLVAALLAATAFTPASGFCEQQSTLKLLPPAVRSDATVVAKPTMELKRLADDIAVLPVQDAADNEGVASEASLADSVELEPAEEESPRGKSSGIKVPTQGATYRGVQSKLEMQPVAGPIFGRGLRSGQPFMRFRAPARQAESKNQNQSHRPIPRPPADRVAEQLPKQTHTGGWVSRGESLNQVRPLPANPSQAPLSDPGTARVRRGSAPNYATSPSPILESRQSVEPRVIAPRGPIASTLEFKTSQSPIDPPSLTAAEKSATSASVDADSEMPNAIQKSILRLRDQLDASLDAPESVADSKLADVEEVAKPEKADIVELVPPKASSTAKAVPSVEVVKRKLAELPEMDEDDNIREELDQEAWREVKRQADASTPKAASKSTRVATRSKADATSRTSQRSRIGDLNETAQQSVTLDYIGMPAQKISVSPYVQQMKPGISRVLQYFYDRPEVASGRSNWGMMHAIMVYGVDTRCAVGNTSYSTIAWIAGNNICRGQRLLTQEGGRIKAKSGVGLQGHQAQMLAVFSLCDVPASYPLYAGNTKYTMQHLIEKEKLDCKSGEELTFTLIGLSHYLDTDAQWRSADGQRWDIQRLIREELSQPINGVACGGTHRLMGYAHALRNRRAEGKPMTGQWARAEQYVRDFVNYTYSLQNRDGSMSTNWYEGRGDNRDVDRKIQTTGHMVEFLLTATPDSQLHDPRLVRAIAFLMNSMNRDLGHEWKIGPKGHALRSLAMYHDRVFKSGPAYRRQSIAQRSSSQRSYR